MGVSPNEDPFSVQCSSNGGASWIALETVQGNSPEANGGWFRKQFLISDFVPNTASFRIRFISTDIGDGSIVESAVDRLCPDHTDCDEAPLAIPGDVDGDGDVDFDDLIGLLARLGLVARRARPTRMAMVRSAFGPLDLLGNWVDCTRFFAALHTVSLDNQPILGDVDS